MYLKTYLPNTPNTGDQIQIQIQIHGLKFDQIQIQIQIRRICIGICKYKYVFDLSPVISIPYIIQLFALGLSYHYAFTAFHQIHDANNVITSKQC